MVAETMKTSTKNVVQRGQDTKVNLNDIVSDRKENRNRESTNAYNTSNNDKVAGNKENANVNLKDVVKDREEDRNRVTMITRDTSNNTKVAGNNDVVKDREEDRDRDTTITRDTSNNTKVAVNNDRGVTVESERHTKKYLRNEDIDNGHKECTQKRDWGKMSGGERGCQVRT